MAPATTPSPVDPRRAAKLSPSTLARYCERGNWSLPPHLRLIERKLVGVAAGHIKRLAISVPSRNGKSWLSSWYYPAWVIGNWPDKKVLLASYGADFAAEWGRKVRDTLTEHGPSVFGVSVRQDSHAADRWDIVGRRGGMQTAGAGGPLRGKGADLFIVDDPHKMLAELTSEPIRERVWQWFQSDVRSRLEPGAGVVVLMQRWHELDLVGRLHELHDSGAEKWDFVEFPALAEHDDVLGRKPGQALWPERYTAEALRATRDALTMHPAIWDAQYQQRPTSLEGGLFKRAHVQRWRLEGDEYMLPGSEGTPEIAVCVRDMERFITVDTATSTKTSADYTAIAAWGVHRNFLVLLDLDLDRIEGPEIMQRIVTMCREHKCLAWIEENSTSKHLLSFMESEGIDFRTLEPGSTDKYNRALPASALWLKGRVVFPEQGGLPGRERELQEAERQLYGFTGEDGNKDDFVDAFSWAARVFREEMPGAVPPSTGIIKEKSYLPKGIATNRPPGF